MSFCNIQKLGKAGNREKQLGRRSISVRGMMNHQQEIEWPLEDSGQLGWVVSISLGESAAQLGFLSAPLFQTICRFIFIFPHTRCFSSSFFFIPDFFLPFAQDFISLFLLLYYFPASSALLFYSSSP